MIPQFVGAIWTDTRLNDSREGTRVTVKPRAACTPPYKADGSFAYTQELLCCDYAREGLKPMLHLQKSS